MMGMRVLLVMCVFALCSCRCDGRRAAVDVGSRRPAAVSCGHGQRVDAPRASRVRALLQQAPGGRGLWGRAPRRLRICFIDTGIPSLSTEGVITLLGRASDAESAARLGHLLLHAAEGPPLQDRIPASRTCAEVVRDAVAAEARAHALELLLRRQLEVPPRRDHPFEGAFWAAPAGERVELLRAHFRAHPEGGPGYPGYVSAYTSRCKAQKQEKP